MPKVSSALKFNQVSAEKYKDAQTLKSFVSVLISMNLLQDFMEKSIYEYRDYKSYLIDRIQNSPAKGRGVKLRMAEYLNCQNTFVSQVINGNSNFSLEQSVKLNGFLEHNKEEGKYFIILIHHARAASEDLKKFYQNELDEMVLAQNDLKKRTNFKNTLKEKDHDIYYSAWFYSAIHILVTIKEFQTAHAIAKRLQLPRDKTNEVLTFLLDKGLIEKNGNIYQNGLTRIHLPKDSVHISRHHANWRMKALTSIDLKDPGSLHFSNVVSIAEKDVIRIRELLIQSIAEAREIVKPSPEEKLYSLCMDFFEV